jgi:hypothetical protein
VWSEPIASSLSQKNGRCLVEWSGGEDPCSSTLIPEDIDPSA